MVCLMSAIATAIAAFLAATVAAIFLAAVSGSGVYTESDEIL